MAIDKFGPNAFATGSVTSDALATGTIATADIADGSISTVKLANDAVTTAKVADTVNLGRRNLIINGAMQVAQRGTSATGKTSNGYYTCDRFRIQIGSIGTYTVEQSTDAPNEFSNSWKISCTTADSSPAASDYLLLNHFIEAQNLQGLAFGTADAKPLTLSFWVKSNKTGNASFEMEQNDNSNKQLSFQYTINSANTWEKKTISIPADTAGVINNDNGIGLQLNWWLNGGTDFTSGSHKSTWSTFALGDNNPSNLGIGGSTSDYWQITGVQLESGDTATPFEHRSFGEELALCQRYYEKSFDYDTAPAQNTGSVSGSLTVSGVSTSVRTLLGHVDFAVHKRAVPTITRYNPYANGTGWSQAGALDISSNTYGIGTNGFNMRVEGAATVTTTNLLINWTADAEL